MKLNLDFTAARPFHQPVVLNKSQRSREALFNMILKQPLSGPNRNSSGKLKSFFNNAGDRQKGTNFFQQKQVKKPTRKPILVNFRYVGSGVAQNMPIQSCNQN